MSISSKLLVAPFLAAILVPACAPKDTIPPPAAPAEASAPAPAPAQATPTAPAPTEEAKAPAPQADLGAVEQAAYERAKPVFEKYCAKCHSSAGKKATKKTLGHFSIDAYPFGGHHAATAGETVREVLGVGEEKAAATMPKDDPGAVKGADLDAVVAWSKAFDASHAAGLHHHGEEGEEHEHHEH